MEPFLKPSSVQFHGPIFKYYPKLPLQNFSWFQLDNARLHLLNFIIIEFILQNLIPETLCIACARSLAWFQLILWDKAVLSISQIYQSPHCSWTHHALFLYPRLWGRNTWRSSHLLPLFKCHLLGETFPTFSLPQDCLTPPLCGYSILYKTLLLCWHHDLCFHFFF